MPFGGYVMAQIPVNWLPQTLVNHIDFHKFCIRKENSKKCICNKVSRKKDCPHLLITCFSLSSVNPDSSVFLTSKEDLPVQAVSKFGPKSCFLKDLSKWSEFMSKTRTNLSVQAIRKINFKWKTICLSENKT